VGRPVRLTEDFLLSRAEDDAIFGRDIIAFGQKGLEAFMGDFTASKLPVVLGSEDYRGGFYDEIDSHVDGKRRIGETSGKPFLVFLQVEEGKHARSDGAHVCGIVDEIVVTWMRNIDLDARLGRADAVELANDSQKADGRRSHVFQGMIKEHFIGGAVVPGPGRQFDIEKNVGVARGGFIDVEKAREFVEAAAEVEFHARGGSRRGARVLRIF
jgi:hypothetical protein